MNRQRKSIELSIGDWIVLAPIGPLIYASLMASLTLKMTRLFLELETTRLSSILDRGNPENPTATHMRSSFSGPIDTQDEAQTDM